MTDLWATPVSKFLQPCLLKTDHLDIYDLGDRQSVPKYRSIVFPAGLRKVGRSIF